MNPHQILVDFIKKHGYFSIIVIVFDVWSDLTAKTGFKIELDKIWSRLNRSDSSENALMTSIVAKRPTD